MIGLEQAEHYMVGRLRARTPLGAAEYLRMRHFDRSEGDQGSSWDGRTDIAIAACEIYRQLFPREYEASQAPPFSTAREQELYGLVDRRLFAIGMDDFPADGEAFLPGIPVRGQQQHDWAGDCCPFEGIQTVFKIALVLSGRKPERWQQLGLAKQPAPPLAAVGWTLFRYGCALEGDPMLLMPLAFDLICYATGNVWLDSPKGAGFYVDWSLATIARLVEHRREAERIYLDLLRLNRWLDADPANVRKAVEIWNAAAAGEKASGHGGQTAEEIMARMQRGL